MKLLSAGDVFFIHENVIQDHELQGLAANKSLDAVLYMVENRTQYGLIEDVYDLAATYAFVLAVGRVFNDANKRTAYRTMATCLRLNGIFTDFDMKSIGPTIIKVAQGKMDEIELARYLRGLSASATS